MQECCPWASTIGLPVVGDVSTTWSMRQPRKVRSRIAEEIISHLGAGKGISTDTVVDRGMGSGTGEGGGIVITVVS